MAKLLVDADACPVVDIAVETATQFNIKSVLFCDDSHVICKPGAETVTVSQGADAADYALISIAQSGDIVVTQDYGVAAMALAKKAKALNQNGLIYTEFNIDGLLMQRHDARKMRNSGVRFKKIPARTHKDDENFKSALIKILSE